eukprot:421130_1
MGNKNSNKQVSDEFINSKNNTYPLPCKNEAQWKKIVSILKKPMNNSADLIETLNEIASGSVYFLTKSSTGNKKVNSSWVGLNALLNNIWSKDEQNKFFKLTLPFIQQCALKLDSKCFGLTDIPLLYQGNAESVNLTEGQVASLLAMSFFGINTIHRGHFFPRFNITHLFGYSDSRYLEKLKCIINYFYVLAAEERDDTLDLTFLLRKISIHRRVANKSTYNISTHRHIINNNLLKNSTIYNNIIPLCDFMFHVTGCIENCKNAIQIHFSNSLIGGNVLGQGCGQNEIKYLTNTECLVSLLLCEKMDENEAIAIVGSRQFSKYKGYGSSFQFNGSYDDLKPTHGKNYKLNNCIVAIDADNYSMQSEKQYKLQKIKRDLLKCYTGFTIPTEETNLKDHKLWIATGNWGCGKCGGDVELKCIIQWIGVSLADRKIQYFAYGDERCKYIESFVRIMKHNNVTVGQLWSYLCSYATFRRDVHRSIHDIPSVFQYIMQHNIRQHQLKSHPMLINNSNELITEEKVTVDVSDLTKGNKEKIENIELINCTELQRLKDAMNRIKSRKITIEEIDIMQINNDFLYLLINFDNDEQFEYIHNEIGFCDIKSCDIFKRNYRNRTNKDVKHKTPKQQILDRIHCFYCHSFDTG